MEKTATTAEAEAATYPHIVRNPRILGGEPTVRGTRIPVRSLVTGLRRHGTPAQVAGAYALDLGVVEEGLAYYVRRAAMTRATLCVLCPGGRVMAVASQVGFPHIVRDPAVQGGDPVIAGTRIPVHDVVLTWQAEQDVSAVLQAYPRLTSQTLGEALAYYEAHRDELEAIIRAQLADD